MFSMFSMLSIISTPLLYQLPILVDLYFKMADGNSSPKQNKAHISVKISPSYTAPCKIYHHRSVFTCFSTRKTYGEQVHSLWRTVHSLRRTGWSIYYGEQVHSLWRTGPFIMENSSFITENRLVHSLWRTGPFIMENRSIHYREQVHSLWRTVHSLRKIGPFIRRTDPFITKNRSIHYGE